MTFKLVEILVNMAVLKLLIKNDTCESASVFFFISMLFDIDQTCIHMTEFKIYHYER